VRPRRKRSRGSAGPSALWRGRRRRAATTRLRRLHGLVATALSNASHGDDVPVVVRRALLSLHSDLDLDAGLLLRAAQSAVCLMDLQNAEPTGRRRDPRRRGSRGGLRSRACAVVAGPRPRGRYRSGRCARRRANRCPGGQADVSAGDEQAVHTRRSRGRETTHRFLGGKRIAADTRQPRGAADRVLGDRRPARDRQRGSQRHRLGPTRRSGGHPDGDLGDDRRGRRRGPHQRCREVRRTRLRHGDPLLRGHHRRTCRRTAAGRPDHRRHSQVGFPAPARHRRRGAGVDHSGHPRKQSLAMSRWALASWTPRARCWHRSSRCSAPKPTAGATDADWHIPPRFAMRGCTDQAVAALRALQAHRHPSWALPRLPIRHRPGVGGGLPGCGHHDTRAAARGRRNMPRQWAIRRGSDVSADRRTVR